ncbi:MAG: hypothetical protein Q9226_009459, partial [Calogaya cf. arnoldii]
MTGELEQSWVNPDYTSAKRKRPELPQRFADVQDDEPHKRPYTPGATTRGHSFNAMPAPRQGTDLQIWNVQPIVYPVYCGYNLRWSLSQIPVHEESVSGLMQRLSPAGRDTIKQRLGIISIKEQEFLQAFIKGNLPSEGYSREVNPAHRPHCLDLLSMDVKPNQIINHGFGEIGNQTELVGSAPSAAKPSAQRKRYSERESAPEPANQMLPSVSDESIESKTTYGPVQSTTHSKIPVAKSRHGANPKQPGSTDNYDE